MNKVFFFVAGLLFNFVAFAQEDVKTMQQNARNFMQQGDYSNAVLVLNKALEQDPANVELQNDLLFNYYLSADYGKAMQYGRQLTEKPGADLRAYQLLGMTYRAIEELKECERLYKRGIMEYPRSGVLYNEYGELLLSKKRPAEAIALWEKGIAIDPNFSGNYYNAAKFYFQTPDKTWSIIYGEIFVNLESYSRRTPEIKDLLLASYKKYFATSDTKNSSEKNEFEKRFVELMDKHASVISSGVTPPSLIMLRTRFILDWFEKEPVKFPFRLYEYHRQVLKDGMFEAYNQWLFGAAQNLTEFQSWTADHQKAYDSFINFQKGRIFRMPGNQNYRQ